MRKGLRGLAVSMIAVIAMTAALEVPASAATVTAAANADSFVLSTDPNANRGGSTSLKIRNNSKIAYIRFDVPALAAGESVQSATLRVYATPSGCTLGVEVLRAANDSWGEKTITWANQPGPAGSVLASATWTATGSQNLNVTSAVTGAGPVSFLLRHAAGCNATSDVILNSRQAAANQPQLLIETNSGTPPPSACSDGLDNDADGSTDYPDDPGCTSATDTDETDPPAPGGGMIATAGDIVCDPATTEFSGTQPAVCQHRATADLLSGADAVLALGDLQYANGSLAKFMSGYDPSWGRYAPITYPALGNHEYQVAGAQGYFDYWASRGRPTGGTGAGYYSFDLGSWHLIALNSNCSPVACLEGSAQNNFLEQNLATTQPCVLAYWHHPLFSSRTATGGAPLPGPKAFWDDLYVAGADIVLNGHAHNYQRYAKQDPGGRAVPNGIREFVVGTGGKSHDGLSGTQDPDLEFGQGTNYGVLKLRLADTSYSWEFVAVNGAVLDSGGPVPCN
jgi:calcineurin-like phosphoesterase family protein